MRFYASLYLLITGIYLFTASGRLGLSDGFTMFHVAQSMVNEHSLSSEPCDPQLDMVKNQCVPGKNGRYYSGYGLLPSVLVIPAFEGARLASRSAHLPVVEAQKTAASMLTLLVSTLVCIVLAAWILSLGYSHRCAAFCACILAFASPLWIYGVKGFYSEPFFTLGLVLAGYFFSRPDLRFGAVLSGLSLGAACACRVNGVILIPVFLICLAIQKKTASGGATRFLRDAAFFLSSTAFFGLFIAWANFARFGSPFKTGYHLAYPSVSVLLSTPLLHGMAGLLFSGEVGLITFVPWVILAFAFFPSFARRHFPEAVLCAGVFSFNFLFFSKYNYWQGGWVAGPRFLLPTIPYLLVVLAPYIDRIQNATLPEPKIRSFQLQRAAFVALIVLGCLIEVAYIPFTSERYYALMEFYDHRPTKPWWKGSIPLASVDFLTHMSLAGQSATPSEKIMGFSDQIARGKQQLRVFDSMSSFPDEDAFLRALPNSINFTQPNLMLVKMKLVGVSARVRHAYELLVALMVLIGLLGLTRYAPGTKGRSDAGVIQTALISQPQPS